METTSLYSRGSCLILIDMKMERHSSNNILRFLMISILIVKGTPSSSMIQENISILTKQLIDNITTNQNYFILDMSNYTGFVFPVDQVLLIHDELSRFVCNNCGVHSIYRVSLSKLPQLTHLMLENNSLQYVHPDAFQYNTRLEKVNLAGNQLSTFNPDATIRHICRLSMLDLSRNEKFDLNMVNLSAPKLSIFTCNHCNTTLLDRNLLASFPSLSQLHLSYNGMKRIEDHALLMAKHFTILNVDRNRNLQRLNLKSSSLKKLSAEACNLGGTLDTSELPGLEFINVRQNSIVRLNEQGFVQNRNINVILLDDNLIQKIPKLLFELPLNGLKQLCLDSNPLQPCSYADEAKNLYSKKRFRRNCMDDGNHLNKFENYLPNINGQAVYKKNPIHHLSSAGTTVDLSNRAIVYIEPDYLNDEQKVTEVLFDNNHSFDFKQHRVFLKSSQLERMSLKNCSISEIYETTFKGLPKLKSLHLQGNNIKSIESDSLFTSNPDIKVLSLSHNNLEFVAAQSFKKLENLEILHLDWNDRLSNKANTPFLSSLSLRKLSCIYCRFKRLDSMTLAGLPHLLELNLDHNYISTVDSDALQMTTQLKNLNLRYNQLVAFEPNINQLSHLKTLCLGASPNFDLGHPKNHLLVENIQKMMQLDKHCQDKPFSKELNERYNTRNNIKHETKGLTKFQFADLFKFGTLSKELYERYNTRNNTKHETNDLTKFQFAHLLNFGTSSAKVYRSNLTIPVLLSLVVFVLF